MQYLRFALVLFFIGLVASLMGFEPLAGLADDGAEVLIFVSIILFIISFVGPKNSPPLSPA